ncbi:hypothetical protein V8D89_010530 [Ganoderma adspersum]
MDGVDVHSLVTRNWKAPVSRREGRSTIEMEDDGHNGLDWDKVGDNRTALWQCTAAVCSGKSREWRLRTTQPPARARLPDDLLSSIIIISSLAPVSITHPYAQYQHGIHKMCPDAKREASPSKTPSHLPGIRDLLSEVLFLVFWYLHGQGIARCMRNLERLLNYNKVCRLFADLIDSDIYLQYRIELTRNGMVDGLASTLPVSERLQHLRQYSVNFRNGIFDFEDPTAHPDYVRQLPNHQRSGATRIDGITSVLYIDSNACNSFLSVFTVELGTT